MPMSTPAAMPPKNETATPVGTIRTSSASRSRRACLIGGGVLVAESVMGTRLIDTSTDEITKSPTVSGPPTVIRS